VLGGYLNFLNNLWFWYLEKLWIKEFPIQFLGEKKIPNQRTSSSGFINQPPKKWAGFTKYGAKNR
jgi:hypothetical protein